MEKKRKHMEDLNRIHTITQTQHQRQPQEANLGGGTTTTVTADHQEEEDLLLKEEEEEEEEEEEDPLQLSLSPYTHRRPRRALPRPAASLLLPPQPQQLLPPVFPHQDYYPRSYPFPPATPTPTPFGAYPEVHRHLPFNHGPLAHFLDSSSSQTGPGAGVLLPSSASDFVNAGAGMVGGGVRTGASTSTATPARSTDPRPSSSSSRSSNRRNPTQAPRAGKDDKIPPPFDWATDRRAIVHSLAYLRSKGIRIITGDVQCRRCDSTYKMEYDLESKFAEMEMYIRMHKSIMHDRAPREWMSPVLPNCQKCGQHDCVKPVISSKKRSINWLFLLLGKMLGCCTLEQLRYFCKHTKYHRTGAKDRVLYQTYLGICRQLDPDGPFLR